MQVVHRVVVDHGRAGTPPVDVAGGRRDPAASRIRVAVAWTDRTDGDVRPDVGDPDELVARQRRLTGRPWAMLDERHGVDVHVVGHTAVPSQVRGPVVGVGDVLVAPAGAEPIAVWVGDCAPIVLVGSQGTRIAVHAGWRGLAAGIVDVAMAELGRRSETVAAAVLGPVVHPCCYEFGDGVPHDVIRSTTRTGSSALDVPAAVCWALDRHGVPLDVVGPCTGCDDRFFSHRVRGDVGRHGLVAWEIDAEIDPGIDAEIDFGIDAAIGRDASAVVT